MTMHWQKQRLLCLIFLRAHYGHIWLWKTAQEYLFLLFGPEFRWLFLQKITFSLLSWVPSHDHLHKQCRKLFVSFDCGLVPCSNIFSQCYPSSQFNVLFLLEKKKDTTRLWVVTMGKILFAIWDWIIQISSLLSDCHSPPIAMIMKKSKENGIG